MQKVTPFLWFVDNGEEAANYYATVFKDAKVLFINKGPDGKAFTGAFQIANQEFMFLNGGKQDWDFSDAVSFYVNVADQKEVDELWDRLIADGGVESQCGWLKDKFGVSWQIIPKALEECLGDPDPEKAGRAMQAMLKMHKIIVADLEAARDAE